MSQQAAAEAKIASYDPLWMAIRREAETAVETTPALVGFIHSTVLSHERLEDAICHRLAHRLSHIDVQADVLAKTFDRLIDAHPELGEFFRADLAAVFDRDPACHRVLEPLLYFKGFHALSAFRFAHVLWTTGECDLALYLQSQMSSILGVDIHPAADIGQGIMIDHATGVVIGETAAVGDNTSILHAVTLGGSGKEGGDRHPKVGQCVLIGAGAKVLGNITVGNCARIAAGSVVLADVPKEMTVAGVPAKIVGPAGCPEPARTMDQMFASVPGNSEA